MKKPMFILRFGTPILHPIDQQALTQINGGSLDDVAGTPIQIGFAVLVMTELTALEIAQVYAEVGGEAGQTVGLAAWPLNSNEVKAILPFPNMPETVQHFRKLHKLDEKAAQDKECTLSVDDLLDKISRVGKDGLTEKEFSRLEFLTKGK